MTLAPLTIAQPAFVLDTNVILDIFSCHDLSNEYGKVGFSVDSPEATWRRARARESILAAIYLHRTGASTYSLHSEAIETLTELVPSDEQCFEMHYTTLFIYFVRDQLLENWKAELATPVPNGGWEKELSPELLAKLPDLLVPGHPELAKPTGNRADAWHISFAKSHGLSLVTNEGFKTTGYEPGKIAKRARGEGVQAIFPKELYAGKIDEQAESHAFITRFREKAPDYVKTHPSALNALQWMSGMLSHVLFGETVGRSAPVQVAVL